MSAISIRRAREADVAAIVAMLADDALGQAREDASLPLAQAYLDAFAAIDSDPNQLLAVMADGDEIIGTLQITFLAGLSLRGAWRGQIEAVRIASDRRSLGLGATMITWAVERFRERGCFMAQLTSNNDRVAAHRFYERLGWKKSHSGFKLMLTKGD